MDKTGGKAKQATRRILPREGRSIAFLALSLATALAIAAAVLASAAPVSAHQSGIAPSLNSERQIVKRCVSNNYCSHYEWSRDTWNNRPGNPSIYNAGTGYGGVSLLVGEDVYYENVDWVAQWYSTEDPDTIRNNNYYLKYPPYRDDIDIKRVMSTHEIGHGFGFGHSQSSGPGDLDYCTNSVMFPNLNSGYKCGQRGYLMSHDKDDWVLLWGTG